jgi:hypothetical protein
MRYVLLLFRNSTCFPKKYVSTISINSAGPPMSVEGHLQTFGQSNRMSALPPKADIRDAHHHVRFGPFADSCIAAKAALFDHLVGAGNQV